MKQLSIYLLGTVLAWLSCGEVTGQEKGDEVTEPEKVSVGMYIIDIHAINLSTHSYGVDLYLWFRWKNPDLKPWETFEFMNPFDPEGLVISVIYDEPKEQPDGSLYQCVRAQGLFTSKFPVNRYPFDSQKILVAIEDSQEGIEYFQYVLDTDALTLNSEVKLPGYRIHPPKAVLRDKLYETTFGDLSEPEMGTYSRVEFLVPISRPPLPGVFKSFVPILLIILSAGFALLLDPEHVEARIGLAITALLTLVAMQFTMLSGLPEVAYLTLIDQIFLISFFYVLVVIAIIVYATRVDQSGAIRGKTGSMAKLIQNGPPTAIVVTGTYLVGVAVILLVNLL
ncbi:MAG: hypothetical protein KDN20_03260 [Verrucomicrobiae bacterium]|nr:hypothetical protein [Verrucomicrobiae bacterium]